MKGFDLSAAHKHFSAHCFNAAWDLLDKTERSADEDEQMLSLAFASYYHWTQRADFTATSQSIALWQISRIYAVLSQPQNALCFGERCLDVSSQEGVGPFFRAYAHEALARAYKLLNDAVQSRAHLMAAQELAEQVPDPGNRSALLEDLKTI